MGLELEGKTIRYSVRQSGKAKTPSIKSRKGSFTVVVPKNLELEAETFLRENKEWVLEKHREHEKFRTSVPERVFEPGESIEVLGESKDIVLETARTNKVKTDNIVLAKHLVDRSCVKDQVEKALREHARTRFENKAQAYSDRLGESFGKVFVRDQDTRWGSCSGKRNLNFNWRLVLGPTHVFDYVVAHEVTHLKHMDHSNRFWKTLEEVYPDWERSRDWFEENSGKLVFDPDI